MGKQAPHKRQRQPRTGTTDGATSSGLQVLLWTLWTTAVLGWGFLQLLPTLVAGSPADLTSLVLECVLVGGIGLVVMTHIEMRLEPWRFFGEGD